MLSGDGVEQLKWRLENGELPPFVAPKVIVLAVGGNSKGMVSPQYSLLTLPAGSLCSGQGRLWARAAHQGHLNCMALRLAHDRGSSVLCLWSEDNAHELTSPDGWPNSVHRPCLRVLVHCSSCIIDIELGTSGNAHAEVSCRAICRLERLLGSWFHSGKGMTENVALPG